MKRVILATHHNVTEVYHGTQSYDIAKKILQEGLKRMNDPFGICVTSSAYQALGYGPYLIKGKLDLSKMNLAMVDKASYAESFKRDDVDGLIEECHEGTGSIYYIRNVNLFNDLVEWDGNVYQKG